MDNLRLHITIFLLKKFKMIMKEGISAPITVSNKIWNFIITTNLVKIKIPEAACGCYEREE